MQQKMMPVRLSAAVLALATSALPGAGLIDYDAAIAGSGFEQRTTAVSAPLDGTIAVPFNFGAISGDATFEFILAGDPVAGGRDGFLGVGTNATFNLRYEQWDDTGQLGFTHAGVADYLITPAAASPTSNTLP